MALDQGAIPQGLIEQARAKPVDPGKLQFLGKQAAALYTEAGTPLSEAVISVIGKEDLGPEHARRVCEFANQEAFQHEWEKGGSVRNIEFRGGPADPAMVLRELNDGARPDAVRVRDYDEPPVKVARADRRVEQEIFGKYASDQTHSTPGGASDVHSLYQTVTGARGHLHSKISGLEVTKEALARELGDAVCTEVLSGGSLHKVASAWSAFCRKQNLFHEALSVSVNRMRERAVPDSAFDMDKVACLPFSAEKIPNPQHPVISRFIEFTKTAEALNLCRCAYEVLGEQLRAVTKALNEVHR